MTKEVFKERLLSLIQKFEKDRHHYLSKDYLEAQVRQDFIDPLFEALGWDIGNRKGLSPFDREVIIEKGETTGRPDYNFRIGGGTKFFVEAKAPSVALDNVNHILQAKTYAWSTREVYFVVLTDFEELKLFDASLRPNHRHPDEGLIFDFKYTDYLKEADKLRLLSREEVEKGSLERLLPRDVKSKKLRIPVDRAFLEEMTGWREALAKDVHRRNPGLDVKLLNEAVQRLLDRVIFIRIAEDRKIREPHELRDIVELWKEEGRRKPLLSHLKDLFREVNEDLNGDIFKPHVSETIDVDSGLLSEIIENLYFPKCRYRFEVLGVELLGSIYERYLGNTIRVTPKRVVVEEKPEVRKAGGVYYTPKYIVDYIVKNTVGRLIEGKTTREIERIRILDPACGSGSFLLGAYQCLLGHHLKYYRENPREAMKLKSMPLLYYRQLPEEMSLPIQEKARILKNNIFGVDIDPQAVEITMMSLYLKALEGERSLLPRKQQLLPSLGNNIKCGNSLIGYDILEGELFDNEARGRINPFDWGSKASGFGEIMEDGGFDAVIGNPPYVRQELIKMFKSYLQSHYKTYNGTADLYVYFIEKGVSLLKENGYFSYIVANKWMRANYGEGLRRWLKTQPIEEIVDFGALPVFEKATTYPCILRIRKGTSSGKVLHAVNIGTLEFENLSAYVENNRFKVLRTALNDKSWSLTVEKAALLLHKIRTKGIPLGEYIKEKIYYGIKTGLNEAFIIDSKVKRKLIAKEPKSEKLIKSFLIGRDIKRYSIDDDGRFLILIPKGWTNQESAGAPDKWKWFSQNYPAISNYLQSFKSKAEKRDDKGDYWWELRACDYYKEFSEPKIIIPAIVKKASYAYDEKCFYSNDKTTIIPSKDKYLLGLLNSTLIDFFMHSISSTKQGGYYEYKPMYLSRLPIRTINFKNPSEKALHDRLVSLVERMLELNKKKNQLPPSAEREKIEREISATDEKIDGIVYDLYGITEEERKLIEGSQPGKTA